MKKTLLGMTALICMATAAKADGLVVADVSIQAGKTATVQVALNNSGESYRSVQFSLALPTGISIVKDEFNEPVIIPDKAIKDAGYEVSCNEVTAGSFRFGVIKTTGNEIIPAECGPLFTFTLEADAGVTVGDVLTATLSDILLCDAWAVDHAAANVSFSITVEEARTILYETSTTAPEAATNVDVRVVRTINANEWSTICLPFAMTEAQVKAAFGDDVQIGDFTGYDTTEEGDEVVSITVNFDIATVIEANHPYIIKVSNKVTEFTVDGVTIAPEDNPSVSFGYSTKKPVVYHPKDFNGTYVADFDFYSDATSYPLFLNGNKFYYATDKTMHMKAFRAYFDFDDYLSEAEGAAESRIAMSFNDETDGVQTVGMPTQQEGQVFDLQGRRVSTPARGLYIRDGKKVIIK